jgi:hypothetical protein
MAKPGKVENNVQSWQNKESKKIIPNPDEARNTRK